MSTYWTTSPARSHRPRDPSQPARRGLPVLGTQQSPEDVLARQLRISDRRTEGTVHPRRPLLREPGLALLARTGPRPTGQGAARKHQKSHHQPRYRTLS